MAFVLFTPAFEGDQYHTHRFSATEEGVYETDQAVADYVVETFPNRFNHCTVEDEKTSEAVIAKMKAETVLETPEVVEVAEVPEVVAEAPQEASEPAKATKKNKK